MSLNPSTTKTEYDVVVVGSGVAGLVSALRAHESGLDVLVVEKADLYGGTTAFSGGVMWIPNNPLMTDNDNVDCARRYLKAIMGEQARDDVLNSFLELGPEMVVFLQKLGVKFRPVDYIPDYFTLHPDARKGRSIGPMPFDACPSNVATV
jgi:3-oxosteroid 1-dehydrogenase